MLVPWSTGCLLLSFVYANINWLPNIAQNYVYLLCTDIHKSIRKVCALICDFVFLYVILFAQQPFGSVLFLWTEEKLSYSRTAVTSLD